MRVNENTIEEIEKKLNSFSTDFNRILYLESAMKKELPIETKRFILNKLISLYEAGRMFEKAGKTLTTKARLDYTFREKIEDFVRAAEMFCKAGKIEDAEIVFTNAINEANEMQRKEISQKRVLMYKQYAEYFEKIGKRSLSAKFYEKLLNIKINNEEREKIKEKLKNIYLSIGKLKEAKEVSKK
ncbi:MAG: hypothetical protein QW273_02575 [Candidatus Pacearchaeota archaeon]